MSYVSYVSLGLVAGGLAMMICAFVVPNGDEQPRYRRGNLWIAAILLLALARLVDRLNPPEATTARIDMWASVAGIAAVIVLWAFRRPPAPRET